MKSSWMIAGLAAGSLALLLAACNGNTVQSPTSQVKQCLFDTECMSSQRCSREKDNLMGICVDKVAAQPGDGAAATTTTGAPGADGSAPGSAPPPAPAIQPQPGDISL
jgi:hypothetical protein